MAQCDQRVVIVTALLTDRSRIDVLCNNTETESTTDAIECPPEEWDAVSAMNVRDVSLGMRAGRTSA